jgi:hypothetical protein
MNPIWNMARKEFSDGMRNRWLLAISLLFAILATGDLPRCLPPSPVWPAWRLS